MTEPVLLNEAALGNLAAILPGVALADATGAIRPDPDAKRRRPQPETEHPQRRAPEQELPEIRWSARELAINVIAIDDGLQGYALGNGTRRRINPGVIRVRQGAAFSVQIFFHVDTEDVPRPQLPFRPPQVGLQWYYTVDGGSRTPTSIQWDPAPKYQTAGYPLLTAFTPVVSHAPASNGWLTLSARIDDVEGAAEFDDTIRVIVEGA